MRVLGVDPGLNITGYGVVEVSENGNRLCEAGVVRPPSRAPLSERLLVLANGLRDVIKSLQPTVMALEELYSHYKRPRTAILMGHARGVICLAAAEAQIPLHSYAATQVKKMMTGSGQAPKSQIQMAVCREFGLTQAPEPPDVADALAIALCHVYLDSNPLAALRSGS